MDDPGLEVGSTADGADAAAAAAAAAPLVGLALGALANSTLLLPAPLLDEIGHDVDLDTCRLLGPVGLVVQAIMGAIVLGGLVLKRMREHPRRRWATWFGDVFKQISGQAFLHGSNLLIADLIASATSVNPCSLYAAQILIDTTLGVLLLYYLLGFATELMRSHVNPDYRSGDYGPPGTFSWARWGEQAAVYVACLAAMKAVVVLLMWTFPLLQDAVSWLLSWIPSDEAQVVLVMLVLPLVMNLFQFLMVDSFLKSHEPASALQDLQDTDEEALRRGFLEVHTDDEEDADDDGDPSTGGARAAKSPSLRRTKATDAARGALLARGDPGLLDSPAPPYAVRGGGGARVDDGIDEEDDTWADDAWDGSDTASSHGSHDGDESRDGVAATTRSTRPPPTQHGDLLGHEDHDLDLDLELGGDPSAPRESTPAPAPAPRSSGTRAGSSHPSASGGFVPRAIPLVDLSHKSQPRMAAAAAAAAPSSAAQVRAHAREPSLDDWGFGEEEVRSPSPPPPPSTTAAAAVAALPPLRMTQELPTLTTLGGPQRAQSSAHPAPLPEEEEAEEDEWGFSRPSISVEDGQADSTASGNGPLVPGWPAPVSAISSTLPGGPEISGAIKPASAHSGTTTANTLGASPVPPTFAAAAAAATDSSSTHAQGANFGPPPPLQLQPPEAEPEEADIDDWGFEADTAEGAGEHQLPVRVDNEDEDEEKGRDDAPRNEEGRVETLASRVSDSPATRPAAERPPAEAAAAAVPQNEADSLEDVVASPTRAPLNEEQPSSAEVHDEPAPSHTDHGAASGDEWGFGGEGEGEGAGEEASTDVPLPLNEGDEETQPAESAPLVYAEIGANEPVRSDRLEGDPRAGDLPSALTDSGSTSLPLSPPHERSSTASVDDAPASMDSTADGDVETLTEVEVSLKSSSEDPNGAEAEPANDSSRTQQAVEAVSPAQERPLEEAGVEVPEEGPAHGTEGVRSADPPPAAAQTTSSDSAPAERTGQVEENGADEWGLDGDDEEDAKAEAAPVAGVPALGSQQTEAEEAVAEEAEETLSAQTSSGDERSEQSDPDATALKSEEEGATQDDQILPSLRAPSPVMPTESETSHEQDTASDRASTLLTADTQTSVANAADDRLDAAAQGGPTNIAGDHEAPASTSVVENVVILEPDVIVEPPLLLDDLDRAVKSEETPAAPEGQLLDEAAELTAGPDHGEENDGDNWGFDHGEDAEGEREDRTALTEAGGGPPANPSEVGAPSGQAGTESDASLGNGEEAEPFSTGAMRPEQPGPDTARPATHDADAGEEEEEEDDEWGFDDSPSLTEVQVPPRVLTAKLGAGGGGLASSAQATADEDEHGEWDEKVVALEGADEPASLI